VYGPSVGESFVLSSLLLSLSPRVQEVESDRKVMLGNKIVVIQSPSLENQGSVQLFETAPYSVGHSSGKDLLMLHAERALLKSKIPPAAMPSRDLQAVESITCKIRK
jgi:hypothetical protein